jgi:hypothetical protein
MEVIHAHTKYRKVKSKNITSAGFDMVLEIKTEDESALLTALKEQKGVLSLSLLEHDGELRG